MEELIQAIWFALHHRKWKKGRHQIGAPPRPSYSDGIVEWENALALVVNIADPLQVCGSCTARGHL